MINMKRNVLVVLFYSLLSWSLFGQTGSDSTFLRIEANLVTQLEVFPQEKIHLHTDRDYYVPGERIWLKAYVVDALTHLFPTYSRYVYIELINSNDSLISRVMLRPENDMFYGHIFLSEIMPEGNYTLRAYTRYMENLGDGYFFKKNIRVGNINGGNDERSEGRVNLLAMQSKEEFFSRREENGGIKRSFGFAQDDKGNGGSRDAGTNLAFARNDFEVSFFPEGGNLLEGEFCKVAFKALNRNGYAEIIRGEIIDENGTVITSVQTYHAGMGVFNYIPEAGKRYFLKCRNMNGVEKQFELPRPNPHTYSLAVSQRNKMFTVAIRKTANSPNIPLYLLGHCRGIPFHFSARNNTDEFITFPEESLPAGVLQFVLFDSRMNPLSERLVFSKNFTNTVANLVFQTDKASYQKREKVITTLSLTPSLSGRDGVGLFSVAITDDKDIAVDSSTTIVSSLLLSSELKGYIENPAYYLQDNPESAIALDYLMLTHGWRRYNIPEAVKGNPETPQIPYQTSQQLSGKVKSLTLSRPVPNSEILITVPDGDFGLTSTDEKGTFIYQDFEYPDSTSYYIQALNKRGSNLVELVLDEESFPKPVHAPFVETDNNPSLRTNAFIEKAEQRSKYDDDMQVIQLSEVEVTASRVYRKDEPRLQFWANFNSDVTIRREEFEKAAPRLVSELLRNIAGVHVSSMGYITIRNPIFLMGTNRTLPLVLIDGIPNEWPEVMTSPYDSPLESVGVNDVESIDVLKGANAAAFGVRGSNGVISITTRRGIDVIREVEKFRESQVFNKMIYTPLGYQKPIEFYSPKYETLESKHLTIPDFRTTIFWKPDIVIDELGEASFEFYTSDFPTTYSVVIEGITSDGRIVRQVEKVQVE